MKQIDDPRLLPCPFCGEDAAIWYFPIDGLRNHESYYVGCTNNNCGCELEHTGGYRTLEEAIEKWNRRANNG